MSYWDTLPLEIQDRIYAAAHRDLFSSVMADLKKNVFVIHYTNHLIFDECYIVTKAHLESECHYDYFHNRCYNILSCINVTRGLSWSVGESSPLHTHTQCTLRTPDGVMQNTGVFAHYWVKRVD